MTGSLHGPEPQSDPKPPLPVPLVVSSPARVRASGELGGWASRLPAGVALFAAATLLVSFTLPWVTLAAQFCLLGMCWPNSPAHASPILLLLASAGLSSINTGVTQAELIAGEVLDLVMLSAASVAFLAAAYRVVRGEHAVSWISVACFATVALAWITFPVFVLSNSGSSFAPGLILGLLSALAGLGAAAGDVLMTARRQNRQSPAEGIESQLLEAGRA